MKMKTYLEYRQIPQKQYLINNIPAGKSGEWPGSKPNHWNGSIRIIHPVETGKVFDDGVYELEKNRRHFKERYGIEEVHKNGRRLFSAAMINRNIKDKKTGLKAIIFNPSKVRSIHCKRRLEPKLGGEIISNAKGIRTYYPNSFCRTFDEITVEKQMGKKKRIWTTKQQRNGMSMKSPGDNFYRTPEQHPTFYKEGGLIPGSTNAINYNKTQSKQAYNFYETLDLTKAILDKKKIYDNKIKKEESDFDKNYVEKTIGKWEQNILNDFDPSYLKKKAEIPEVDNIKRPLPKISKNTNKVKGKK